jgi:membrane-bound lytic murein transglycosylase B
VVLALVSLAVRADVEANSVAAGALGGLTPPAPGLPTLWHIQAPAPEAQLLSWYHDAAAATGTPWSVLAAIHFVETRLGRIHGLSPAGAQGPMQFMPATWAAVGAGDIHDDHDAIFAAARLLARDGARTNLNKAVFAYNHDDRYVQAVLAYAGRLDGDWRAFNGYYQWQVQYRTAAGTFVLPEGWRGDTG